MHKSKDNHLPSPIISCSFGLVAVTGEWVPSTTMLGFDESGWILEVVKASSLIKLFISSYFQSVKYPGLVITVLTSISPESMATTRDIGGRSVGDA